MTLTRHMTEPTEHQGLESLAASIAMASGLIRDAEQWPDEVKESGHRHGCRELALRYMRVLASALPDSPFLQMDAGPWLTPTHEELYGVEGTDEGE